MCGAGSASGCQSLSWTFQATFLSSADPLSRALPASELQPPKPRQQTTAAVARRLIGAGLGINLRDRAEETALRGARQQHKQQEQERQKALDAVWD